MPQLLEAATATLHALGLRRVFPGEPLPSLGTGDPGAEAAVAAQLDDVSRVAALAAQSLAGWFVQPALRAALLPVVGGGSGGGLAHVSRALSFCVAGTGARGDAVRGAVSPSSTSPLVGALAAALLSSRVLPPVAYSKQPTRGAEALAADAVAAALSSCTVASGGSSEEGSSRSSGGGGGSVLGVLARVLLAFTLDVAEGAGRPPHRTLLPRLIAGQVRRRTSRGVGGGGA